MSILKPENLIYLRGVNSLLEAFEKSKNPEEAFKEAIKKNEVLEQNEERKIELVRTLRLLQLLLERAVQARKMFREGVISKNEYWRSMRITYKDAAIELNNRWNLDICTKGNRLGRHLGTLAGYINYGAFVGSKPLFGGLLVRKDTLKPGPGFENLVEKIGLELSYRVEEDVNNYLEKLGF